MAVACMFLRVGPSVVSRTMAGFHTSHANFVDEKWKSENGMPLNPTVNTHAIKEWPDYSFVDGRTVPVGAKQLKRWERQRELASKAVQLLNDISYAVNKHKNLAEEKELENQRRISNKLKPKGSEISTI